MTPEERSELLLEIKCAIKEGEPKLCPQEIEWVKRAIEIQTKRIAFMDSVISKSLAGLLWSFILFLGYLAMEFLRSHGFKP